MLDFRKVLLALSVAGLGLVGTVSAQVPTYTIAASPGTGYVAAEGTTEQLPLITLTPAAAVAVPGSATFTLTSNVPFANQLLSGSTSKIDVTATDGTNVATATLPGPTTVQLVFSALTTGATITVSNLRVNASLAPISTYVTISAAASGVAISAGSGASTNAGFVTKSISSVAVNTTTGLSSIPVNTSSCGILKTTVFPVSNILITEGFPDALKAVGDTDTGAYAAGTASAQGTALAITFTNLDAGVNYYVPTSISGGSLVLTAYTAATGGVAATPVASGSPGAGSILVTSASPTVYYVVTTSGGVGASPVVFLPVTASIPSVSGVTAFASAPIGVSVVLAGAASPAYPGYSTTFAPYTGTASSSNATNGIISPCATTLLFPYVVNTNGFDTGFAIANASTLPTGVTGISASTGSCTVTFYGNVAGTVLTAPVTYNYGTVTTGTVGSAFALSQTGAAGLTGYAVAVCNFVGAHGYAILLDVAGANSVAANYLAVVLSSGADGYSPTGTPAGLTPTF